MTVDKNTLRKTKSGSVVVSKTRVESVARELAQKTIEISGRATTETTTTNDNRCTLRTMKCFILLPTVVVSSILSVFRDLPELELEFGSKKIAQASHAVCCCCVCGDHSTRLYRIDHHSTKQENH